MSRLLTETAKLFEREALKAAEEDKIDVFTALQANHQLYSFFATKFEKHSSIGEPTSREVH